MRDSMAADARGSLHIWACTLKLLLRANLDAQGENGGVRNQIQCGEGGLPTTLRHWGCGDLITVPAQWKGRKAVDLVVGLGFERLEWCVMRFNAPLFCCTPLFLFSRLLCCPTLCTWSMLQSLFVEVTSRAPLCGATVHTQDRCVCYPALRCRFCFTFTGPAKPTHHSSLSFAQLSWHPGCVFQSWTSILRFDTRLPLMRKVSWTKTIVVVSCGCSSINYGDCSNSHWQHLSTTMIYILISKSWIIQTLTIENLLINLQYLF